MTENEKEAEVKVRSAMLTDVGIVREHNEDSAMVDEDSRFFVVADGMGGHAAGEVASAMAVAEVRKALGSSDDQLEGHAKSPTEDGRQEVAQVLEEAVRDAHRAVFERGVAEPEKQGMGTTLDVVLLCGNEAFVAHVGDSRTYLLRNGTAAQITTDHTVAEVLVIEGKLSAEEALVSPLRTILVNALGVSAEVGVELAHLTLHQDDRLLMCSDGLHDYFPQDQELHDMVLADVPEDALRKLVDAAKERGGHDNITAVIVEVLKAPAVPESTAATVPIIRATSDGIPHAIGKEDTLPVDAIALTPPQSAADDARSSNSSGSAADAQPDGGDDDIEGEFALRGEEDYRATVPIRMPKMAGRRARSETQDGIGEPRSFGGEPTVELQPDGSPAPLAQSKDKVAAVAAAVAAAKDEDAEESDAKNKTVSKDTDDASKSSAKKPSKKKSKKSSKKNSKKVAQKGDS
jgi:serine/threonine protein phosphatase PrpC